MPLGIEYSMYVKYAAGHGQLLSLDFNVTKFANDNL